MKAVVVHKYGGPEVLKLEDYPDPVPGAGEVLVRVAAAKYPAVKVAPVFLKFDRKTIEFMAEAVRDGKLVIPISETPPLRQAAEAQAAAEKGVAGKILLVA